MHVITDHDLQQQLYQNEWQRDWIWSVCRCLVVKWLNNLFKEDDIRFYPPSVEAWSSQWHDYIRQLPDNLNEHIPELSFREVENEWHWRMKQKERTPKEYDLEFRWNLMKPTVSHIEVYLCLFSFHQNKYGTYDYEWLGFSHQDLDELYDWTPRDFNTK